MSGEKQYFGIKFPFTDNKDEGHFLDLCDTLEDSVASEIAHVILTEKGTRIRKLDFGTNLLNYIFDPSDSETWEQVKNDTKENIERYVRDVSINNIEVIRGDEDSTIYVDVKYSVIKGNKKNNERLVLKL